MIAAGEGVRCPVSQCNANGSIEASGWELYLYRYQYFPAAGQS